MITWILSIFLFIWCIIKRVQKYGKVEGYPLGMPRGTVRAIITIMVVAFPFNYLIFAKTIPVEISNALFILVAFYFEARKSGADKLKVIREVRKPEKYREERLNEKFPLYFPLYTVRSLLAILLVAIYLINILGPNVSIESSNTIVEILTIIALYIIGNIFRTISVSREKEQIKKEILKIEDYQLMSKHVLYAKLMDLNLEKKRNTWRNSFSLITFIAVTASLMFYTLNLDVVIPIMSWNISLRYALLLLINLYYGFRE